MARRTKEEAEETRRQILSAALDVFSRKGYSRTTFVDIAKQIGLSKGAVFWHFASKTDLLVALLEWMCACKRRRFGSSEPREVSVAALRECYVESVRETLRDEQLRKFEFFINFQIEWSEGMLAEVREGLEKSGEDPFRKFTVAILELQQAGLIDAGGDAERLGAILFAAWIGLSRLFMLDMVTEDELYERLAYSFDALFMNITTKDRDK